MIAALLYAGADFGRDLIGSSSVGAHQPEHSPNEPASLPVNIAASEIPANSAPMPPDPSSHQHQTEVILEARQSSMQSYKI